MAYLLDTNIAIHARDGLDQVIRKLIEHKGVVLLSALSLAELQRGVYKRPELTATRKQRLDLFLDGLPIIPFDAAAAEAYGQIIAQCGWVKGRDFDRLIAAHALATNSILVTNNEADFRDVPGLSVQNWALSD